jgi:hypothetical protein
LYIGNWRVSYGKDKQLSARCGIGGNSVISPKSDEFKQILSDVRKCYATAKRQANYSTSGGCNYICLELDKILEDAKGYAAGGDYALAYAVVAIVLQKCAWLSSHADSSSGWLTDTVNAAQDVAKDICQNVPLQREDAKYIFAHGIKDFSHKDFEGWSKYSYDLLRSVAKLTDEKTASKLYQALDAFTAELAKRDVEEGYTWRIGKPNVLDMVVRYEAMRAVDGDAVSDKYVYQNIAHHEFRKIAVQNAIARSDFAEGERLCLDALATHKYHERPHQSPSGWEYFLQIIYEKKGDTEKQIETARQILLLGDLTRLDVLKELLKGKGTWESEYPALRDEMESALYPEVFMYALNKEGDWQHLMEQVSKRSEYVFTYGKALAALYSEDVKAICIDEIRETAEDANTRPKYRKVCKRIEKLASYAQTADALAIIEELAAKYHMRPAMLDELEKLEPKLRR